MKCKITRHKKGADEDAVVVTTLVTAIGNHQGADHVEGVLRSLETGGWKMNHRLCVFSVFGDTVWSPLGAARDEGARSNNHHAIHRRSRAEGEAASRGISPRSPGFDCTQIPCAISY